MNPTLKYAPLVSGGQSILYKSALLKDDVEAQNLAWLSFDAGLGHHPDPNFTTLVRRSTQFVMASAFIDLTDSHAAHLKLRSLLRQPPAQAVLNITKLEHLVSIPLFRAYGTAWLETIKNRSRLYREPHSEQYDKALLDLAAAQAAIQSCK